METHRPRFPYLALSIVGIAVILSSTAGIAGLIGWLSASTGSSDAILALDDLPMVSVKPVAATARTALGRVEGEARVKVRCAECGVIVSTREIDAPDDGAGAGTSDAAGNRDELQAASARRFEITIRMADRSSREINHAGPANWRPGEHVIVIDGANRSSR